MKGMATAVARVWRAGYGVLIVGMALRAGMQAILVVLLARTLGASEYGLVVAITSVASIFSIFMGAGATALHLRDLSIGEVDPSTSFRIAMRRNLLTLPILLVSATACVHILYGAHIGLLTATLLISAELVGFAAPDLMQRTMQGRGLYGGMAIFMCVVPALRISALTVAIAYGARIDIETWTSIALVSAAPSVVAVCWRLRVRPRSTARPRHDWLEGIGFAVAAGSTRVHADADKAIVARISSLDAAAQYSLAYRLFDVLMLPVLSYIEWRMPALFHAGQRQRGAAALAANRNFITVVGGSSLLAAALSIPLVSLLPALLGHGYENVVTMGHWLVLLPMTNALWWIFRSLLSTSGDQSACGAIELAGAAFNVASTLLLVGWMGWRGAVVSTYATHLSMSCAGLLRMRLHHAGSQA